MSKEPFKFINEAQSFVLAEMKWMLLRARQILKRFRLPDIIEACDLAQEAFIKSRTVSDEKWREIPSPKPYLSRMMFNHVIDLIKKDRPNKNRPLEECIEPSTSPQAMEEACLIRQLMQRSSPEEVKLLKLVYMGHTDREIAKKLGITPDAARKRVSRLMRKLDGLSRG